MDKHVLSCEQIIIQGLFAERETVLREKEGDLDHIFKFIASCIPFCYRHIPISQETPKPTPHLILPGTENISFHWLLRVLSIDAMHTSVFLLQCNYLNGYFLSAINLYPELCLKVMIEFLMFIDYLLGRF